MDKAYSKEWFLLKMKWLEQLYYKTGIGSKSFTIPYDKRTAVEVEKRQKNMRPVE